MKIFIATVILIYYAICVHGHRAKRGLSADEQKKLMDQLKKDRAEIGKQTGIKFGELTYDPSLEDDIDSIKDCAIGMESKITPLKYNSVVKKLDEFFSSKMEGKHPSRMFFNRKSYKIGCSKTFKCSKEVPNDADHLPAEVRGKTAIVYGACITFPEIDDSTVEQIVFDDNILPPVSKYADIIGVVGSSEDTIESSGTAPSFEDEKNSDGKVFNILITLFFLIFHV